MGELILSIGIVLVFCAHLMPLKNETRGVGDFRRLYLLLLAYATLFLGFILL